MAGTSHADAYTVSVGFADDRRRQRRHADVRLHAQPALDRVRRHRSTPARTTGSSTRRSTARQLGPHRHATGERTAPRGRVDLADGAGRATRTATRSAASARRRSTRPLPASTASTAEPASAACSAAPPRSRPPSSRPSTRPTPTSWPPGPPRCRPRSRPGSSSPPTSPSSWPPRRPPRSRSSGRRP